jgi:sporulation protein YlmC with PRC-barrel domain
MNTSSEPSGMRVWRAPLAALILALAGVPAFAHDDDEERRNTETTPVTISSVNPCFGPADPVTDEHPGEPIEGPGVQETTTREKIKRDGTMETRTRTKINGKPVGSVSQVKYVYENDNTTNLRFRPNGATKFVSRSREEGIPMQSVGVTGQRVPSFVVTTVEEQEFDPARPAKNKFRSERDEKCRDKKGRDRCNDHDRHDDHRDRD